MMRFLPLAVFLLICAPALAQGTIESEPLKPMKGQAGGEASAAASRAGTDEDKPLSQEEQALLLCQTKQIMGSTEDAGVPGADYQPGVDAYGRPVAPANGEGSAPQYTIPERIDIPLNIAILKTVGVVTTPTPELTTNVGTISILKGGQVLYNGQNMTRTVQDYCAKHMDAKVAE